MKILVRLPNWLGDMVMSVGFVHQLPQFYPGAEVSVIAKKGIHDLLDFFPPIKHRFVFSKEEFKGLKGLVQFGDKIKQTGSFDLFFCLPDSLSAAVMGAATGSERRVGYKKELRQVLLTDSFSKPEGLHRVEEYTRLMELFTNKSATPADVSLHHSFSKKDHIVININSEASSRRLTVAKAVELLSLLRSSIDRKIILIGAPKERLFVQSVVDQLDDKGNIYNLAGETSLYQLSEVLASAQLMLTTDSGPAHLANALGTHTVVLFGAGKESNTAPYRADLRNIIRLGQLSCEPCQKNICVRYSTPQCLERLDSHRITETIKLHLN
ncbi:MAG: glycosyltransferase family 9 protein [Flavisolibacter sp.]